MTATAAFFVGVLVGGLLVLFVGVWWLVHGWSGD